MTTQRIDICATIPATAVPAPLVDLRGGSGRLYGRLDPQTLIIEVKRKGEPVERIDLKPYLEAAKLL